MRDEPNSGQMPPKKSVKSVLFSKSEKKLQKRLVTAIAFGYTKGRLIVRRRKHRSPIKLDVSGFVAAVESGIILLMEVFPFKSLQMKAAIASFKSLLNL